MEIWKKMSVGVFSEHSVYKSKCVVREPWLLTQLYKQADRIQFGMGSYLLELE